MALSDVRLGDYIKLVKEKCGVSNLTPDDVSGINRDKEFFEPSKQVGGDTSNYKIVPPDCFACNIMHVGRDEVLPIALNVSSKNKIVSPAYTVFRWTGDSILLKEYLFMMLKSTEKDRYFWFHCDSSVRDGMDWDAFCDIELEVPSIDVQKKYVAIYEGLLANIRSYEKRLDDLKLVCDGYIEDLRREKPQDLKGLLFESSEKNEGLIAKEEKGVSIKKTFIDTKAKSGDLSKQKVVRPGYFAFNANTSRNSDTLSIALNDKNKAYAVSNTYIVFQCDQEKLLSKYLYLWFNRKEFDRFARFNSWGSAREMISLNDIEEYVIAIPSKEKQIAIIEILESIDARNVYLSRVKDMLANLCPILIRGSLSEINSEVG